jgi:hypothetical protein
LCWKSKNGKRVDIDGQRWTHEPRRVQSPCA